MLKHYSHIRMEATRTALESIVAKKADSTLADKNDSNAAECVQVPKNQSKLGCLSKQVQ